MKCYIGAKIIQAEPMSAAEFNEKIRPMVVNNGDDMDEVDGYMVVYPGGYKSWSPKDVFEEAYRPVNAGEAEMVITTRLHEACPGTVLVVADSKDGTVLPRHRQPSRGPFVLAFSSGRASYKTGWEI
jgi:hypothetical protein